MRRAWAGRAAGPLCCQERRCLPGGHAPAGEGRSTPLAHARHSSSQPRNIMSSERSSCPRCRHGGRPVGRTAACASVQYSKQSRVSPGSCRLALPAVPLRMGGARCIDLNFASGCGRPEFSCSSSQAAWAGYARRMEPLGLPSLQELVSNSAWGATKKVGAIPGRTSFRRVPFYMRTRRVVIDSTHA